MESLNLRGNAEKPIGSAMAKFFGEIGGISELKSLHIADSQMSDPTAIMKFANQSPNLIDSMLMASE
jgi:hypothetical protein